MRLTRKVQYGVLFSLYLARAGRATIEDAAHNLGVSKPFLEQVARRLRIAGVISSTRGPGGGYEIDREATMVQVFNALSPVSFLTNEEYVKYAKGAPENRALALYTQHLALGLHPVLRRKVSTVMNDLVANELVHLNRLDVNGLEQ